MDRREALLVDAIVQHSSPERLRYLIATYLDETPATALNAQWHPLGFVNIPLFQDATTSAKVHVWHPTLSRGQVPQPLCHSHGWRLVSTVLCGELYNDTYLITPDDRGQSELYRVEYEGDTSVSLATESFVTISLADRKLFAPGATYELSRDDFHSTRVGQGVVVTAMHGDLAGQGDGFTVLPRLSLNRYVYHRALWSASDRRLLAVDVLRTLREFDCAQGH